MLSFIAIEFFQSFQRMTIFGPIDCQTKVYRTETDFVYVLYGQLNFNRSFL